MASILFDSTVLIDILRGRPRTRERLLQLRSSGDIPYTCAINVDEITRGLRAGEEEIVRGLFDGLLEAPLGKYEGERAGLWRRDYADRGITLSQADCLIASAAITVNARLATGNPKDFPMTELVVEHWPTGE